MDTLRAIVIEDDDDAREIAERQLIALGYEVVAFAAPEAALDYLITSRETPDLLLTDLCLPWMDGAAAMGWVRAITGDLDLPTVAVSAVDQYDDVAQRIILGGGELVPKPALLYQLAQAIVRATTRAHHAHRRLVVDAARRRPPEAAWAPTLTLI